MDDILLEDFAARLKEAIGVLSGSSRDRADAFRRSFNGDLTLIIEYASGKQTAYSLAIHACEVVPLVAYHYSRCYEGEPLRRKKKVSVELIKLTVSALLEEQSSSRFEPLSLMASSLLRDLSLRLRHLTEVDISHATGWVWHGKYPYPVIDGKVRFLGRQQTGFVGDQDVWLSLPFQESELSAIEVKLGFPLPRRLALTMSDGCVRPFEVTEGFIGTDSFEWLRAHSRTANRSFCYEGIAANRDGMSFDCKSKDRSADQSEAQNVINFKISETSRAYGLARNVSGETVFAGGALDLVSGSSISVNDDKDVFAIADCSIGQLAGYQLTLDGSKVYGPGFRYFKMQSWGAKLKSIAADLSNASWHVFCFAKFTISEFEFLCEPKEGPYGLSLVGQKADSMESEDAWGAIDTSTGKVLIPFKYRDAYIHNFGYPCMVFSDQAERHVVFDENGQKVLGPLLSFESPTQYRLVEDLTWPLLASEAKRRDAYIKRDLPMMFSSAKAEQKFGFLSVHAPDLSAFEGKLTHGYLDAKFAGLWMKRVEVNRELQIETEDIAAGTIGTIEDDIRFGELSSSNVDWLSCLPVSGLISSKPEKVLPIPFDCLRLRDRKEPGK